MEENAKFDDGKLGGKCQFYTELIRIESIYVCNFLSYISAIGALTPDLPRPHFLPIE